MAYWMCKSCGHCLKDLQPPDECPICRQRCSFANVTCYTPECGGERNPDPKVMAYVLHTIAAENKENSTVGLTQRTSISSPSNALCYEAVLVALQKFRDQLEPSCRGKV